MERAIVQTLLMILALLTSAWSGALLANPQVSEEVTTSYQPKGAACVIRDEGGRIVLVQDYLTRKLSLPGGYIGDHEAFHVAAKRETWEETGIDVDVGPQLAINAYRVVFACQAKVPVGVMVPAWANAFDAPIIPAFNAPHFGKEIRQVYLTALAPSVKTAYRYPDDWEALKVWGRDSSASPFYHRDLRQEHADTRQSSELAMMTAFQSWVTSHSPMTGLLAFGNGLGEGALAVGVLIVCLLLFPLRVGLTLAFVLLATAYSVNLLKMAWAIPRPFYLLPALQQAAASGFSFPSGHTTQAAALMGTLLGWLVSRGQTRSPLVITAALLGWLVVSALAGAARVWLGVHYPTDVLAGMGLGGLIALVAMSLYHCRYANQKRAIESKRLWALLLVLCLYGTLQLLQPLYLFAWFACLGLVIALCLGEPSQEVKGLNPWRQVLIAVAGLVVVAMAAKMLVIPATTSVVILTTYSVAILVGMLWMVVGAPKLSRKARIVYKRVECALRR
ncbi:phosphatase PAP2 family protein (plasmid) [Vibrio coralliilyticus]|uniref:bifunctional NUDIX hydrolase/phosphatase PAP2 family protein n=1 Tax=Vibrio coralliilyticus TaxID=190893 RepID=UPI00345EFFBE